MTTGYAPAHPAPQRHLRGAWYLWLGLFGGPLAWSVQLIAAYAVIAHFCFPGRFPLAQASITGLRVIGLVVSAAAFLLALWALFVSLRSWEHVRQNEHRERHGVLEVGEGRTRFMSLAGLIAVNSSRAILYASAGADFAAAARAVAERTRNELEAACP